MSDDYTAFALVADADAVIRMDEVGILEAVHSGAMFARKPFIAAVIYDRLEELLHDGKKPDPINLSRKRMV